MSTELKIGDLVTAYDAGIWRVIEIKKRVYETETDIPSLLKDTKKRAIHIVSPMQQWKEI